MASLYFDKLYPMGVEGMVDTVAAIADGTATLTPQAKEGDSFQGLITDDDARIDLASSLDQIDCRIRGCDPGPGAWLRKGDQPVRLFGCSVDSRTDAGQAAGTVISVDESGLVLAVAGGALRVKKVRGSGGKVIAAESGIKAGDQLR
jgi:methionyl-tRNA formyltransferase